MIELTGTHPQICTLLFFHFSPHSYFLHCAEELKKERGFSFDRKRFDGFPVNALRALPPRGYCDLLRAKAVIGCIVVLSFTYYIYVMAQQWLSALQCVLFEFVTCHVRLVCITSSICSEIR
jgi:hypothetical protein